MESPRNRLSSADHVIGNFHRHATLIPSLTNGMKVLHTASLSFVDSGLSCDTFNIIHINRGETLSENELKEVIQYYKDKNFAFCIWVSDEHLTARVRSLFEKLSLGKQNMEPGMVIDLKDYQPIKSELHLQVKIVSSKADLGEYAWVVAANWTPPDENVVRYYEQAAPHILDPRLHILFAVYHHHGKPASGAEMFPTDSDTLGLYGLATLTDARGQGIGSAMLTFCLNKAKEIGYKRVILQASDDGFGIYERYGFKVVTRYCEFA